jgi:nucleoside 2-deoxyribosyltransferase
MGFVGHFGSSNDSYCLYVAPAGWKRISELTKAVADSQQAFVAMWFSGEMDPFYRKGIKPAVEDSGYKVQRIDEKEHINDVRDEIMAEIRRSRFVVADFTGQRGGVYFEAGFAQGLGLPVIWTVRQDHIGDLHFDTRQYNHLFYETPEELRVKLRNRIVATIGQGPVAVPNSKDANA